MDNLELIKCQVGSGSWYDELIEACILSFVLYVFLFIIEFVSRYFVNVFHITWNLSYSILDTRLS